MDGFSRRLAPDGVREIAEPLIQGIPRIRFRRGRHRWVIERAIAWLGGFRRLTLRYERHGHLFALAAALTCYKKLAN